MNSSDADNSTAEVLLQYYNCSDYNCADCHLENGTLYCYESPDETKEFLIWAMGGVALTAVSTFGIVGNTMSVIVLTRKRVRGSSGSGGGTGVRRGGNEASFSSLLRGLATFDALFLITAVLSFGLPKLSPWFRKYLFAYSMKVSTTHLLRK